MAELEGKDKGIISVIKSFLVQHPIHVDKSLGGYRW
jgi:hypothetical protein